MVGASIAAAAVGVDRGSLPLGSPSAIFCRPGLCPAVLCLLGSNLHRVELAVTKMPKILGHYMNAIGLRLPGCGRPLI
jgi:hypothetical protein